MNCGAITRDLFGSELFGHSAGAFTGASREGKPGVFELEFGDASIRAQFRFKARNFLRRRGPGPCFTPPVQCHEAHAEHARDLLLQHSLRR